MATNVDISVERRRRTNIKASCTRIKTFVDSISNVTNEILAQLEERKAKLEAHWDNYNSVQDILEFLDEKESSDREVFEEAFYALSAKMRVLIAGPTSSRAVTAASPSLSNNSQSDSTDAFTHIRLPKLNLPTFTGKYEDWFPFFDTFNSVINNNQSLTNTQKLQYLKASLAGEAADVIHSLELSDHNYEVAWDSLKLRYDNERIIVQTHVRAIVELPATFKESCQELRRIADGAAKHVRSLQALKRPTEHWDDLLVYILSTKLDPITTREWQTCLKSTKLPTFKEFLDFLIHKCQSLEATSKNSTSTSNAITTRSHNIGKKQASSHVATVETKCSYCKGNHPIYFCADFSKLTPEQRLSEVRRRKLCTNCIRSTNHKSSQCKSGACRTCGARHNTLLHVPEKQSTSGPPSQESASSNSAQTTVSTHSAIALADDYVMLSTAIVCVTDVTGTRRNCRALLDSGSQANFVSQRFLNQLKIKSRKVNIAISGINQTTSTAHEIATLKLHSRINPFDATIDCIVTEKITDRFPSVPIKRDGIILPRHIILADPKFNISSEIDLLIGADLFWQLLCVGQIKASSNHPTLQKTHFGWILAGRISSSTTNSRKVQGFAATIKNLDLESQLQRFWQLEEVKGKISYSADERACESKFANTVTRNEQGRFIVQLPIKESLETLGDSRATALRRFHALERRLSRDPALKVQYTNFIKEYLALGHMRFVHKHDEHIDRNYFYLPHHCVIKESSETTKLRVVFDGSSKSSSGVSLNDILMVGPVVQQDLLSIIMRFRIFTFVFVADITKMYRQILVHPSQTSLQRILWRDSVDMPIGTYELTTVTYGTSSASYLATRCLNYLAELESKRFPLGSKHVLRDFYVDDLLTGSDNLAEAKAIKREVVALLQEGQFELRKWASNSQELVEPTLRSNLTNGIDFNKGEESRVLGIRWNPISDSFHFFVEGYTPTNHITKRTMLSDTAKLFDPLGLLGPVVIIAKLLIQELWQIQVAWDASVPISMHTRWLQFRKELGYLNELKISRCVKFDVNYSSIELHGFSDASQKAYGACIYLRSKLEDQTFRTELLCSKSRVAPLKSISLPRLELCAAHLLARLFDKVRDSLDTTKFKKFFWVDSTITLHWIKSPSRKWVTFVANRVGEIQTLTDISDWRHVSSINNPADLLSRGMNPLNILQSELWLHGPNYLQLDELSWPNSDVPALEVESPEAAKIVITTATLAPSPIGDLLDRFSNLNKICRITAYCMRFISLCKTKTVKSSTFVTPAEVRGALHKLCKFAQSNAFQSEILILRDGKPLPSSSKLLSLTPFLDDEGLLRVGGRLKNAKILYSIRHPILLPKDHRITKLLICREHSRAMHAGVQLTIATVRQEFWPLSIRSTARKIIRNCITCFRAKPRISEAVMGELPSKRVEPSKPFLHCGVDYAGPILVRDGRRRNSRHVKAYIAIFVCFSTKAVHIELVGDLTSDAFLGALKRFISRRGNPASIHSDNGTTFTGASRQLKEFFEALKSEETTTKVQQYLSLSEVSWHFIPPYAPHFGGLWEAAVKSAKFHLQRIVGDAHLTFEELSTVLCEIEAILNSRPITPMSDDPNDCSCLTPGHFLTGDALISFPQPNLSDIRENRLTRWQRVEQLRQHFWRRWSLEYLSQLQIRHRWTLNKGEQLKLGQLVLIRQQGLPPLQWLMGRIQEVHPGSDGIVRSATVKTNHGTFLRPLSKLSIVPLESDREIKTCT